MLSVSITDETVQSLIDVAKAAIDVALYSEEDEYIRELKEAVYRMRNELHTED